MSQLDTGRIQVYIVGEAPGLEDVRRALELHEDVEVVGAAVEPADARLADIDVDSVLYAAADGLSPEDLAAVRRQTAAPVTLLAGTAGLLEEAVAADVADALLLPQPVESVLFTLRRQTGRRERHAVPSERGRVITVFAAKGGTGKSATATNLALLFATEGRRTLLVDLDLQFGDSATMLSLQPDRTIHDLVGAAGELDVDKLAGYVTRHASGLELLAAPARPEEAELVSASRVARLLEVACDAYDLVVVDTAPFLHGPILAVLDDSDELLVLATLDVPTLKDTRQLLETLRLIPFPPERVSLVLNRADAPVGITRREVEAAWGHRFRFTLPDDLAVPCAVNRGKAVLLSDPDAAFSRAVREVAAELERTVRAREPRAAQATGEGR